MDVVAVVALDQALVDAMAIRLSEISLRRDMTAIAEIRLGPDQQMLRLSGMVRRMAVQTADIVAGVCRYREVPLRMAFTVAGQAVIRRLLL